MASPRKGWASKVWRSRPNASTSGSSGHVVDGQGMGSVYGYRRDAGGQWVQNSRFEAHDGVPGQSFGTWIGASGSTVMVGASTHDASRGAVYLMFDGMIFKDGFEAIAP